MNMMVRKSLILIIGFCLFLPYFVFAQGKSSKKHEINWSINLSKGQDSARITMFNLGLLSNISEQRGTSFNLFYSAVHRQMYGFQFSGVLGYAGNVAGVQLGTFANIVKNDVSGVMLSGLLNAVGGDSNGVQLAGITNITGKRFDGLMLAGLMNVSAEEMNGVQLSSLINTSGDRLNGVQLSLLGNVGSDVVGVQSSVISNIAASRVKGVQLAGVANIAFNVDKALQFSSLTNVCLDDMDGIQLALGNYAENVDGVQIGLVNISTGKVRGWQFGIVNHSKDTTARKIGLVNVTPRTKIQAMIFGSNTSKINLAIRFKNKMNYSILGIGTHYADMNNNFSGSVFYRTGLYFPLKRRFEISGDLGYYHIENFEDADIDIPERLYSVQARVNLSYKILPKLSIFASTGYAMTRHYKKNKSFSNKGIIEGGIILF